MITFDVADYNQEQEQQIFSEFQEYMRRERELRLSRGLTDEMVVDMIYQYERQQNRPIVRNRNEHRR